MLANVLRLLLIIALAFGTVYIVRFYEKVDAASKDLSSLNFRMQYLDKYISLSEIINLTILSRPFKVLMTLLINYSRNKDKKEEVETE